MNLKKIKAKRKTNSLCPPMMFENCNLPIRLKNKNPIKSRIMEKKSFLQIRHSKNVINVILKMKLRNHPNFKF